MGQGGDHLLMVNPLNHDTVRSITSTDGAVPTRRTSAHRLVDRAERDGNDDIPVQNLCILWKALWLISPGKDSSVCHQYSFSWASERSTHD
ncbi:hypothetical protein BaRGS_00021206 [Batillaria attramentaria]|uniref:Uncharacterized protein n=1 Tax=Batillaria attramentaria TaxID=370345 RepID=A0ABD0KJZ5_9CAEN